MCARNQRYGGLELEGPIYGKLGELDTALKDAWVRDGCNVDGTLHIGLTVVVYFPGLSQKKPVHLVMGPSDTVGDVKQVRVTQESRPYLALWGLLAINNSDLGIKD